MTAIVTTPDDLSPLAARLTMIEADVGDHDAQIGGLNGAVEALAARLDVVEAKLADHERRLIALESAAPPSVPPIPELARWEARMLEYAALADDYVVAHPPPPLDPALASIYYDQDRVMQQIAAYTGSDTWRAAAARARAVYQAYLIPNNYGAQGYRNFTTGFRLHWQRSADAASRAAVVGLSTRAAYAADGTNLDWTKPATLSREVAYAIVSYIDAEHCGEPRRARRSQLLDQAYGHLDQFRAAFETPGTADLNPQPFMVGLTAHALIRDWETSMDGRCEPALTALADVMWERCWIPEREAFWYDELNKAPAPDLNLLICPLYAWLWIRTRDPRFLARGDALFAGGVKHAYLGAPASGFKQFNQNYWWSFDYVGWRS